MIFALIAKEQLLNGLNNAIVLLLSRQVCQIVEEENILNCCYFFYLLLHNKLFTVSNIKQQSFYYSYEFCRSRIWTWQWLCFGMQYLGPLQNPGWLEMSWILGKRIIWRLLHLHIWLLGWDDSKAELKIVDQGCLNMVSPCSLSFLTARKHKGCWASYLTAKAPRVSVLISRYMVFYDLASEFT